MPEKGGNRGSRGQCKSDQRRGPWISRPPQNRNHFTNKTNPGELVHTGKLHPVTCQVGEVQKWLPEAAQQQRIGDSTTAMGLLPQGPPDHPQKQRHGQCVQGAQDANQDEGNNSHNA